ncbi:2OG-Fe(II) oxygenase family protein [Rhizobium sp. TH2]|uniref:HalD/BesD family halogenase n=1 Tax=Rhizobium sp. TH2 TaxID=2775403 RepID=UPI0021579C41|nr:2OG-Fe(II) oxygenase [Rhizobium sp. TH2]UVC09735.1 2OG-Fe(II) oxygenase family protein [Rhizobium sp. TH2]
MRNILDLDRYPLDQPGSTGWRNLVDQCRIDLSEKGMFDLEGFVRPEAVEKAINEVKPVMDTLSFVHKRAHNVYFRKEIPELPADHPALRKVETISHTVCADQISDSVPVWIYEWPQFAVFLAACMEKETLFTMRDPLARVNVMGYREGEALNWHFDRSQFTTTILFQAPIKGGEFQYRSNLRTDTDPNYEGVERVLLGEDNEVKSLTLVPGSLNVFMGKNTMHRVTPVKGERERLIAVFSYYERPGVMFSKEEQMGFYGRAA